MTKKEKQAQKDHFLGYLREQLTRGERLYFVLINHSNTGTSRLKVFYHFFDESRQEDCVGQVTYSMAQVLGYRFNKNDNTIVVPGCGYDKAQHLTEHLGQELFGETGALKYSWL